MSDQEVDKDLSEDETSNLKLDPPFIHQISRKSSSSSDGSSPIIDSEEEEDYFGEEEGLNEYGIHKDGEISETSSNGSDDDEFQVVTEEEEDDEWELHEEMEYEESESDPSDIDNLLESKQFKVLHKTIAFQEEDELEVVELLDEILPLKIRSEPDIPETPAKEAMSLEALADNMMDPILLKFENESQERIPYESQTEPRLNKCPSICSYLKQTPIAEVNMYLLPGKKMISKDCRLDTTIYQLKIAMSRYVRVSPDYLDLRRNKNLVLNSKTLGELGIKPNQLVKFVVETNRRYQLNIPNIDKTIEKKKDSVRIVTCISQDGFGNTVKKQQTVLVVHPTEPKPMIGGYYDKQNEKTFHNASTNPMDHEAKKAKAWSKIGLHQASQTYNGTDLCTQTLIEKGIQMERQDYYVTESKDFVLYAMPYITADEYSQIRHDAAITIQKYWRRRLAINEKHRRIEGLIKRIEWAESIRKGRLEQRYNIQNEELERQQNPTSMLDLELLYRAIDNWKLEQREYVKKNRWGPEGKAALAQLSEMETDLLLNLDRRRVEISEKTKDKRMERMFKKMGEPERWLSSRANYFISIDSQGRMGARQLHKLYKLLKKPVQNNPKGLKERLTLLDAITDHLREQESKVKKIQKKPLMLIDMINDLIEREMRFISVNASPVLLAGVRKRVANTFYCLCKDPNFNHEATRCEKIPYDPSKLRKEMRECKICQTMQCRTEFTIVKGSKLGERCKTCMSLYRTAIVRVDLNLFRQILKELRQDEYQAGIINSVTFLMDPVDIKYLVERIWHGQSALSGIDNRYLLRLCRWRKEDPWAPWNCVLLTEEEAVAHLQLEDFKEAYQTTFFHKVEVKHSTARVYFEGLARHSVGLDDRIKENCEERIKSKGRIEHVVKGLRTKGRLVGMLNVSGRVHQGKSKIILS